MLNDFGRLAGLAMARLGWSADMFWQATPVELRQAIEALVRTPGVIPMSRNELEALAARYPDNGFIRNCSGTGGD